MTQKETEEFRALLKQGAFVVCQDAIYDPREISDLTHVGQEKFTLDGQDETLSLDLDHYMFTYFQHQSGEHRPCHVWVLVGREPSFPQEVEKAQKFWDQKHKD